MEYSEDRIIAILDKTERALQEEIAAAAHAGDYHSVDIVRVVALEMEKLRKRVKGPPIVKEPQLFTPERSAEKRKSPKSAYPKFAIRNGVLTRTGWSTKKKREYRQRIPRITFDQTLEAMASLSHTGNGSVLADQIIEGVERINQEHVPSYQVYAVLGLLRHASRDACRR